MDLFFYNKNLNWVKDAFVKNHNAVAFWYSEGLDVYLNLFEELDVSVVNIEESIYSSFINVYFSKLKGLKVVSFPSIENHTLNKKICFYASNDTHVYLFKNVLDRLKKDEYDLYCDDSEKALTTSQKLGFFVKGGFKECKNDRFFFSTLILGNDWGIKERILNAEYIKVGINTTCIQESILDLNEIDNRLGYCNVPVFQGVNSLKKLNLLSKASAVIGNPRFEDLRFCSFPLQKQIFINVNFTYGIHEEARSKWLNDILTCANDLNLEYIISQHPRDKGVLEGLNVLKSNAGIVHQTIKESSLVISRFSALLLEAVALGRPAIYYNPHGEKMTYDFAFDNKSLFYIDNEKDLKKTIKELIVSTEGQDSVFFTKQLDLHLGVTSKQIASFYISQFVICSKFFAVYKKQKKGELLKLYFKLYKVNLKAFLKRNKK